MGWSAIGPAEAARIAGVVSENVHAIRTAIKGKSS
jgi:hypothetical protein